MTYLDRIIAWHRDRAAGDQRDAGELLSRASSLVASREPDRFLRAVQAGNRLNVIAEVKRRSPSKGDIRSDLDPRSLGRDYADGGAACLSVLTDEPHFGGSIADLVAARDASGLPVLRKDFLVDERDVIDACLMGADAALLIVAALTDDELCHMIQLASRLRLAALVEVHDDTELSRAVSAGATLIGVNQRDLHTFNVDSRRAEHLAESFPVGTTAVAESGITSETDAQRCAAAGYRAILVGEYLVRHEHPRGAIDELRVALPS